MSNPPMRQSGRQLGRFSQPGPRQLLSTILNDRELVDTIQALPPQALSKLIAHIGLEDSGELVALATTEQLKKIFDDDLWRKQRPGLGKDETFDAERFALWLKVMLEAGEEFTAQKLTELPEELFMLALHSHILVINIDELAVRMSDRGGDDYEQTEKALESCLYHEFDEYRVIARSPESWDEILAVLLELDKNHGDFLRSALERFCYASADYIEESGGLYQVLSAAEMLESDAAAEREDRRAQEGFVAPSAAVSFLDLAQTTALHQILNATEPDPLTKAYFRLYEPAKTTAARAGRAAANPAEASRQELQSEKEVQVARLVDLLKKAEVLEEPRLLLPPSEATPARTEAELPFARALATLSERNPPLQQRRHRELNYLANVLVAGCSLGGRAVRPVEAAKAVLGICNSGLVRFLKETKPDARAGADAFLDIVQKESADKLFRIGWHTLHAELTKPAGRALDPLVVLLAKNT